MGRADERRARRGRGDSRGRVRRLFTWKKLLGTFFGLCLLGIAGFVGLYLYVDVPQGNPDATQQANVYKLKDGTVLARTGQRNREIVGLDRVPKDVQHTFVAAENKSFYKDKGVDLKGTARGLLNTVTGKGKQGGSTITQQYVKNYYLTADQTVSRKLKELVISLKVDQKYSKDDILAGYINTSYYGRGAYGIQAAAQAYYGVDADQLDVAQGAYLAALLQAPSQYDWAVATPTGKTLVTKRWNYVLDNMVDQHWLGAGERAKVKFPVPREEPRDAGLTGQKGYLQKAAENELIRNVAENDDLSLDEAKAKVDAGGYSVTLNIDPKKQAQLEKSVKNQLISKLDPKNRTVDANVQAGAASVDPKNGKILALYGGRGWPEHYTDNATRTDYQVASTFKPLILAAALENGATTQDGKPITASTVYDGTSRRPVKGSDVAFAPPNEDGVDYGPINVQTAMNKSVNSVFAQMGVDVGMDEVMKTAGKLGMDVENEDAVPAQTLGSMGASPLQMAGVYATLDHHGRKVTPQILKSVTYGGADVKLPSAIGDQVVSRQTADSVTSVLTGVVDDGTGSAVRNRLQPVAGKTGTSDDNKSAWFTGFTPNLVTSVGVFGEAAKAGTTADGKKYAQHAQVSLSGAAGGGRVNGGGFPAQIWADYTFKVAGAPEKFDLDTDMGAATTPTADPTPSDTPTLPESPSPSTSAPEEPSPDPTTESPSPDPTTPEPDPTDTGDGGLPTHTQDPGDPGEGLPSFPPRPDQGQQGQGQNGNGF
ncbi:transglycosylase domain-containing protein [Streptomyces sp. CH6]|uniref:transglycosylase domain-containing protein n=1 Tax=Streptomyces sp. CH6 TaxID=3420320 RepID=UPI003D0091F6